MRRGAWRSFWVVAACVAALGPGPSFAQSAPKDAPKTEAAPPNLAEAQKRYRRGVELVNEGAYESALLEFRRAYELAPTFRILFNMAQVNRALNDYAAALRLFERYLKEGGADVPADMGAEVRRELEVLRTRVSHVVVSSNVVGAEVQVDDVVVGKTPLAEPVLVNAGRRKVTVTGAGRLPATKVVEATATDTIRVQLDLAEPGPPPTPIPGRLETGGSSRGALPWALWGGAALLAGGAAVTGVLALGASKDFDEAKGAPLRPGEDDRYDDARAKMTRLSVATDVLAGLALVTGGAALYFTLKPSRAPAESARAPALSAGVGPGGLLVRGAF
jgi:hypothetical protein